MKPRNCVIIAAVLVFVGLAFARNYRRTTFDFPLYVGGDWDEPFAINSAINILRYHGDPRFYKYGGVSLYPQAALFRSFELLGMGKADYRAAFEPVDPSWPMARRIRPLWAIYVGRRLTLLLFALTVTVGVCGMLLIGGSRLMALTFGFLLLSDPLMNTFSTVIKPETYEVLFSLLCYMAFICCIESGRRRYFVGLCVACGLAVGAKLTALGLFVLIGFAARRLSMRQTSSGFLWWILFSVMGGLLAVSVFAATNPTVVLDTRHFVSNLSQNYDKQVRGSIPWLTNLFIFMDWFDSLGELLHLPRFVVLMFIVCAAVQLIRCGRGTLVFATLVTCMIGIVQRLSMVTGLYSRLFIHLNPIIYFFVVYPIALQVSSASRRRSGGGLLAQFDPDGAGPQIVLLFAILISYRGWLGALLVSRTRIPDTRLQVVDFIKKTPTRDVYIFNCHNYSLSEELERLTNVHLVEGIKSLPRNPPPGSLLMYFHERELVKGEKDGDPIRYVVSTAQSRARGESIAFSIPPEIHRSWMKKLEQFPLEKTLFGNPDNAFGCQGPQLDPTIVFRRLN
jgi:hypothetical protein